MSSFSVLLVQPDTESRTTLIDRLKVDGYTVYAKSSANDAMAHLQNHAPDVLITDIMLGGDASGLELLESVRAMPEFSNIPVFVLGAREDTTQRLRALKLGANAFMIKTSYQLELYMMIVNMLVLLQK